MITDVQSVTDQLHTAEADTKTRVRELNDDFRTTGQGGQFLITAGIEALPPTVVRDIIRTVMIFDDFGPDNDPHKEHDFGSFKHLGHQIFFKIDTYDLTMTRFSPDPSDPDVTKRVITIMFASEY